MEHCQSNLKALRQQHTRFSESMIRHIMRDICMGLRHLHNQKIVHLDIKPGNCFFEVIRLTNSSENILYSKTKKYKIADLGLSRIAQRSNHEDINEGDCRYLAPELLKDYPDQELPDLTKADIFSFGASIYELMIGMNIMNNFILILLRNRSSEEWKRVDRLKRRKLC
jgi:wee1-like protein kinase